MVEVWKSARQTFLRNRVERVPPQIPAIHTVVGTVHRNASHNVRTVENHRTGVNPEDSDRQAARFPLVLTELYMRNWVI